MSDILKLKKGVRKEEMQKLSQKENNIFDRAKEIEQEMEALKNEKVDLLINLYRDQVMSDAQDEKAQFSETSDQQFEKDVAELSLQKDRKYRKLDELYV